MARARGANARMALAFEQTYGVSPTTGYRQYAFASNSLGEDAPLIDGELLGRGREPGEPTRDASTAEGQIVVPVCARQFGTWLTATLGAPTTAPGKVAKGSITFSANPVNNGTITIGAQVFTFTTSAPSANQIKIEATLAATLANAVRVLNASAVATVAGATYRQNDRGNVIEIEHDALGVAGNALALEASTTPASNATVSGATLTGGAANGGFRHRYQSGAATLPSLSIEQANPEVPNYGMNFGCKVGTLGIQLQRGGNLTANLGMTAQGEDTAQASIITDTVEAELAETRFAQASASVRRNGVPIADLTGAQITINNGIDAVPGIRSDGRVTGMDEGQFSIALTLNARFSGPELQKLAEDGEPCEIEIGWIHPGTGFALRFIVHRVFLPKSKRPVTGPAGIQADYNCIAAKDPVLGRSLTVLLDNDQPGTVYATS